MASSKLLQFQTKGAEAFKKVSKKGGDYFKQVLEKNHKYVVDPPTPETCIKLSNQLFYTTLASMPHRYGLLKNEIDGLKQVLKKWHGLSVDQYGLVALFGIECYMWSWLGEALGRGSLFGYMV